MSLNHIFWPVLAQVLLTLVMFTLLGVRKARALRNGKVDRKRTALDNRAWPEDVVKVSNNVANQFEAPVLFYVLCLVIYSVNASGTFTIILAWLFVLSRFAHAHVHVGSNYVPMRLRLFLFGSFVLLAMLILVVWKMASDVVGA